MAIVTAAREGKVTAINRLTNRDKEIPMVCSANDRFWANVHEKLARYEDAEEQGRLVILPCKVGDTLFFAQDGREEPFSMRVQGMSISASGNDVILHFGGFPITNAWGSEVGKALFLTREEAEAALKGERKDV